MVTCHTKIINKITEPKLLAMDPKNKLKGTYISLKITKKIEVAKSSDNNDDSKQNENENENKDDENQGSAYASDDNSTENENNENEESVFNDESEE